MTPMPKGSKRIGRLGGHATGRPILLDNRDGELKRWQEFVAWYAKCAFPPIFPCPVHVDTLFYFERPKSHYRANGELKPDAPAIKATKPDGDKLERAVWDALTGVFYKDDCQVATWGGGKFYVTAEVPRPGVVVRVRPL